jgi:hypothetical protein
MDGFNGSSLNIKINQSSGRVTIGNVNFGESVCAEDKDITTCNIQWLNSTPYYNFDVNRYRLSYELKSIVSVLKVETNETANFMDCVLNSSENFISGERLKITLTDLETLQKKEIIFFNFGTQNFSTFVNPILPEVKFYYSFDFENYFASVPYFFDSYDVRKTGALFLYRIGARSLDESNSTFVHYCLYDSY